LPQKSVLKTTFQQLSRVGRPQLPHHAGAVRLNGLLANPQLLSYIAVLKTLPDEAEYLLLPPRQRDNPISLCCREHIDPPLDDEKCIG
jgi:hypothetical protein